MYFVWYLAPFRIKHTITKSTEIFFAPVKDRCFFDTRKPDPLTKIIRRIIRRRGSDIRFHKVDFSMKSTTKQVGTQTARYLENGPTHTLWNRAVESLGESREGRIQVYVPECSVKKKNSKSHNTRVPPL